MNHPHPSLITVITPFLTTIVWFGQYSPRRSFKGNVNWNGEEKRREEKKREEKRRKEKKRKEKKGKVRSHHITSSIIANKKEPTTTTTTTIVHFEKHYP